MRTRIIGIGMCLTLLIIGFISSCDTENVNKKPSELRIDLYLKGSLVPPYHDSTALVYPTLIAGNDTLRINLMYIFQGKSKFVLASRSLLVPHKRTRLIFLPNSFTINAGNFRPLVEGNIHNSVFMTVGKQYAGTYKAFHFKILPVSDSTIIIPHYKSQTVTRIKGGPYSMLIKGTYNNSKFIFKTKKDFDIPLKINPPMHVAPFNAHVTPFKASYSIIVTSNMLKWFKDGNGLLDPSDTTNIPIINANIENSFSITAGTNE